MIDSLTGLPQRRPNSASSFDEEEALATIEAVLPPGIVLVKFFAFMWLDNVNKQ